MKQSLDSAKFTLFRDQIISDTSTLHRFFSAVTIPEFLKLFVALLQKGRFVTRYQTCICLTIHFFPYNRGNSLLGTTEGNSGGDPITVVTQYVRCFTLVRE